MPQSTMFGGDEPPFSRHHNDPFEEEEPARDPTDPLLDPPDNFPEEEFLLEGPLSPSSSLEEFGVYNLCKVLL